MKTPEIIKTVRTSLGLSQVDFARLLDISRAQLSMAELGRRALRPSKFVLVVKIFNLLTPVTDRPSNNSSTGINKKDGEKLLLQMRYKVMQITERLKKLHEEKELPRPDFSVDPEALKAAKLIEDVWLSYIQKRLEKTQPKESTVSEHDLRLQLVALEAQIKYLEEVMK